MSRATAFFSWGIRRTYSLRSTVIFLTSCLLVKYSVGTMPGGRRREKRRWRYKSVGHAIFQLSDEAATLESKFWVRKSFKCYPTQPCMSCSQGRSRSLPHSRTCSCQAGWCRSDRKCPAQHIHWCLQGEEQMVEGQIEKQKLANLELFLQSRVSVTLFS